MELKTDQLEQDYFIIDQPMDITRRLDINYLRTKFFVKLYHFLYEDKDDIYLHTYKINYLHRLFTLLNTKYNNIIPNLAIKNNINIIDVNTIIEHLYIKDNIQNIPLLEELIKYVEMDE